MAYFECLTLLLVRDDLHQPLEVEVGAQVYLHAAVLEVRDVAAAGALQRRGAGAARGEPLLPVSLAVDHLAQALLAERVGAEQHFGLAEKV